jgi:hypothetical protein
VDSGATFHMKRAWDFFESFTESNSYMYVELGMGTNHAVQGSGTMAFWMELGGVLRVTNVIWVPELKRSVLSVSTIEKKGFEVLFRDGHVLIIPIGSCWTHRPHLEGGGMSVELFFPKLPSYTKLIS